MSDGEFVFRGKGSNVVGSFGSGSMVLDMPSAYSFGTYDLDYAGSFIDCGDRPEFEFADGIGFILAGWVKLAKFNDHQFIAGKSNWAGTSHSEYFIGLNNDSKFHWVCNNGTNGGTCQSDNGFQSEVDKEGWTHVMGVRDTSNNLTLYINGVAQADTETCTGNVGVSSQDLGIGTRNNGGTPDFAGDYFRGNIRDVRLYSGSATATELQDIFADTNCGGVTLQAGSIEGWWQLDGNLNDSSGNGFTGVLTTGSDSTDYWDGSIYNLNQIGAGSVSGSVTVSGGTWNLKNSSYISPTGTNNTNSNYIELNNDQQYDGSRSYAMWFYLSDTGSTQVILDNYLSSLGTQVFINGGTPNLYLRLNNTNVFNFPANVNEWNHLVWTIDETNNLTKGYLNSTEVKSVASNRTYGTVSNMRLGSNVPDTYPTNDGNYFSEYVYYTSVLTPTQIDLLYKGQWIGSPDTWLKMDEGTGTSITNHGTDGATATLTGVSSNKPAWVNPDYEVTEGVTTIAGSLLSAPLGVLSMGGANWGAATFIHNSGTVTPTNAGVVEWEFSSDNAGSDNALYNLATNAAGQMRFTKGYIVENLHSNAGGNGFNYLVEDRQYNYGTTSSAASSSALLRSVIGTATDYAKIYGVSKLHPFKLGAWDDTPLYTEVALKNVNVTVDIPINKFAPSGRTVRLDGDCEFEDVLVETDTKLDLNGQRVKFNGDFTVNSGGHNNGAGLIFAEGDFSDGNGTGNSYTTKTLVMDAGYCNPAQTTWQQMFLRDGTQTIGGSRDWGGTPIIMGGTSNFTSNNTWGDITIPTSGTLDGNAAVITTEGDFNIAGGIIGKSALLCAGTHWASGASVLNYSSTDVKAISIGAWVKGIDVANGDGNQMIVRQNDNFLGVQSDGSIYVGVEVSQANGTSWDYPGLLTADGTISDNKWHHIGMTWASGSTLKAYLDGKLVGEKTDIGAEYVKLRPRAAGQSLGVGAYQGNAEYEGIVGQGCRWHTELSESDIRTHMFQDFSSLASTTNLIYWYQFDSANGTAILDSSTNDCDLTSVTVASNAAEAAWVAPGTYTYDTSTLKFNKAGTCNFTANQDTTALQLHSIHITSGTTVAANCRDNDFVMNSGSLMTNSGTLTSNRNWQYKSRNMPIVGPNSDLKVSTNIWYYMSDGSGLPASGAGTNYYQLRPATNVYMQGDFDCQNGLLHSGGDLHLNGYACSTSKIWNYGGGNMHADPGSSIVFDTEYGFNVSYGENPTTMFFVASGEACAMFNQFSDKNNTSNQNYIDTNAAIVPDDAAFTVSFWYKSPTDLASYSDTLTTAIGFNYNSEGGISLIGSNWLILCQGSVYRYFNSAPNADGLWHHMLAYIDPTNASNIKMWIDGSEQSPNSTSTGGTTSWSGDVQFGRGGYGAMPVSLADIRFYNAANTPTGSVATLAAINPATNVSGAYADPSNALSAYGWFKLNGTDKGLVSIADTIGTYNSAAFGTHGSPANGVKSGFVTISGSVTPYNPVNNLYPAGVTLKNVYISGSKDIVAGQRKENSAGFMIASSQIIKTEGTVVLD